MAARLGASFLVGALGPVNYAGTCLMASRVPEGLHELSPESLSGGVERGIAETAKRVGVGIPDVEQLLPMSEIRTLVARIGVSQNNAVQAWHMHAGQVGGFLKGIADLTADGRPPDVALCLQRLAEKVSRDPELAEPLSALAVDISSFRDILARCRDILEDGEALANAYRRRKTRRLLLAVVPGVIAVVALAAGLWLRDAQLRIDEALARPDPCEVIELPASILARSSLSQRQKLEEQRRLCQAERGREELARKEAERREAGAREAERRQKELEERCEALATHLSSGKLLAEDQAFAGGTSALLQRIARHALSLSDLGPEDPPLPCGETPSGSRIVEAFSRAIIAVPFVWANAPDPSAVVRAILVKHVRELPSAPKQVLAAHADDAAKKALLVGRPGMLDRATRLCDLKESLGIGGGRYCSGVTAGILKKQP
jgi:hypothetical protein